jgi:hypothetical protein
MPCMSNKNTTGQVKTKGWKDGKKIGRKQAGEMGGNC